MIPRIIKTLTEFGESALKPLITKNKYYGPLVSKRNQADLRKRSIVEGTYGQFIPNVGGWDSKWDVPKKMFVIKPNKGHSYERNRQDRYEHLYIILLLHYMICACITFSYILLNTSYT